MYCECDGLYNNISATLTDVLFAGLKCLTQRLACLTQLPELNFLVLASGDSPDSGLCGAVQSSVHE